MIIVIKINKRVSNRKKIALQHSCHTQNSAEAKGVVDPVKIFVSFPLITIQNSVIVSHTEIPKFGTMGLTFYY